MSLRLWISVVSSPLLPCSGSWSCRFCFLVLSLAGGLWLCLWSRLFLCSFIFSKVSRAAVPGSRAYLTNRSLPVFSLASLSSDAGTGGWNCRIGFSRSDSFHASMASTNHLLPLSLPFSFSIRVHSYFSFAKVAQASFVKYQSLAPYPGTKLAAAFRIFFLADTS